MIPGNAITPTPIQGLFKPPENGTHSFTTHTVFGGIALNDPSKGRQYRQWSVTLLAGVIEVRPVGASVVFTRAAPSAISVSLAFDSNMGLVVAWQNSTGTSELYYFDTLLTQYTTRSFSGTTSCKVCVDDARPAAEAASDVIFAYTRNNNLYWRQQRDRYDVERLVGATNKKLIRLGLSETNRLQFECQ